MKQMILMLVFLFSMSAIAFNPMGGSFYNPKSKKLVTLTCLNDEIASECKDAYFTLVDGDQTEILHSSVTIPMDDITDAHHERYYKFYVLRDRLIEGRAIGPTAWVVINGMRISKNFKQAVTVMFSKNVNDFDKKIKMTPKNFDKMVEIIRELF